MVQYAFESMAGYTVVSSVRAFALPDKSAMRRCIVYQRIYVSHSKDDYRRKSIETISCFFYGTTFVAVIDQSQLCIDVTYFDLHSIMVYHVSVEAPFVMEKVV